MNEKDKLINRMKNLEFGINFAGESFDNLFNDIAQFGRDNPDTKLKKILNREKIMIFLHGVYESKEIKDIIFDKMHILNKANECYKLDPLFHSIVQRYYSLFEE